MITILFTLPTSLIKRTYISLFTFLPTSIHFRFHFLKNMLINAQRKFHLTFTNLLSGLLEILSVTKLARGVQLGILELVSSLSDKSRTLSLVRERKLCIRISSIPFDDRSKEIKCGRGNIGRIFIPQFDNLSNFNFGRKWNSSCNKNKCTTNSKKSTYNILY